MQKLSLPLMLFPLALLALSLLAAGFSKKVEDEHDSQVVNPPLLKKVSPDHSGINFKNTLTEILEYNLDRFHFDYFYNGAGVGVADLNNDGLEDLFFTGNQVKNRLYVNKGDLRFEDVSGQANISENKGWATGVTFADVNGDGWLDVYVCQGGPLGFDRSNRLYINQGDLTFSEQAAKYGLDHKGISTQSAFFDYDQDGDLDCLVMNEHPLYGYTAREFQYYLKTEPNLLSVSSSHLFEFDGNRYVDVTEQAGLLTPTFGLGLVVSDINQDNWPDIYICNDYYIPDALYINQKDGTFKDEIKHRTKQIAFAGMGTDIADFNNDGQYDIITLDMASRDHVRAKTLMAPMNPKYFSYLVDELEYHHAYMYNTLQLNVGNGTFQDIAHITGVAKTDWSWAVFLADLDNDADKDVLVTNGTEFTLDNDFHAKVEAVYKKYPDTIPTSELIDLHAQIPTEKLPNLLFENQGGLAFANVSEKWGFDEPTFSNGAAYADLDKDGDLDIVINNNNQPASLYRNFSREEHGNNYLRVEALGKLSESFPKVTLRYNGQLQTVEISRVRGYLSAVTNTAHFGLGDHLLVDTVSIIWPSGQHEELYDVKANQTIQFLEKDGVSSPMKIEQTPRKYFSSQNARDIFLAFKHTENAYDDFVYESLLPYRQSSLGPFMAKGDLNGDGKEDLFIGGALGQPGELYFQTQNGFEKKASIALDLDKMAEDMEAIIFDVDQDQDNDLLVISGGNEHPIQSKYYADRLYLNDGRGNLENAGDTFSGGQYKYSGRSVASLDYDRDGDLDIIIGNRMVPRNYPKSQPSFVFNNDGGKFRDVTDQVAPGLAAFGAINKIISTDFDNDGWVDLIAVGEWTHVGLFKNENGVFKDIASKSGLDQTKGWWFTIGQTDVNNDQLKDYIIGNLGLNSKYKATAKKPLKIFAGDFDRNGTHDMMLSYEYKNEYVPLRGRECSSGQMPFIQEKFPSYHSFANATMVDLFGQELETAYQREATEFESILLLNKGGGIFEKVSLPVEAQFFPVLACEFYDVDGDGFEDAILAGGIYKTEVETPRLDAGVGQLLLSDGRAGYRSSRWENSGLFIPGDVKSIELIKHQGLNKTLLLVGVNDEQLEVIVVNGDDELASK